MQTLSLTKRAAKERLGFETDVELADFFGVTAQAVGQWPDDAPIPRLRQLEAAMMRPELFIMESSAAESEPQAQVQ